MLITIYDTKTPENNPQIFFQCQGHEICSAYTISTGFYDNFLIPIHICKTKIL